jgi:hypothetical protein
MTFWTSLYVTPSLAWGRVATTLYSSTLWLTLMWPSSVIVIPVPAVSLFCFLSSSVCIWSLSSETLVVIDPLELVIIWFNTLSSVVIPRDATPERLDVLTTTASERVIGTNWLPP